MDNNCENYNLFIVKDSIMEKISTKDKLAFATAIASFTAGTVMAFLGMFLPPVGEISGSVLSYTGMSLSYTASILSVAYYFKEKVNKLEEFVEHKLDKE